MAMNTMVSADAALVGSDHAVVDLAGVALNGETTGMLYVVGSDGDEDLVLKVRAPIAMRSAPSGMSTEIPQIGNNPTTSIARACSSALLTLGAAHSPLAPWCWAVVPDIDATSRFSRCMDAALPELPAPSTAAVLAVTTVIDGFLPASYLDARPPDPSLLRLTAVRPNTASPAPTSGVPAHWGSGPAAVSVCVEIEFGPSTGIEPVGVSEGGSADLPHAPGRAGLYRYGPPLAECSARPECISAVAGLIAVRVGDEAIVQRAVIRTWNLSIARPAKVDKDHLLASAFVRAGELVLALITCALPATVTAAVISAT
ncbi:hypothetical protein ACWC24_40255 [Streptomyces sp. NPDC001443]